MAYTKEEIQSFEEKDKRITRLSCLNRATDIAIAFWTHPLVTHIDPTEIIEKGLPEICKMADVFVDWVYQDLQNRNSEAVPPAIPAATEYQQNILDKILVSLRAKYPDKLIVISTLQKKIYDKYGRYPENPQSVVKIVSELEI